MSLNWIVVSMLTCIAVAACSTDSPDHPRSSPKPGRAGTYRVRTEVVYTPATWPCSQAGDLYLPEAGARAPAIVMVHGGGWDARDRTDMSSTARKLAARGYAVFNIDYRLAPEYLHPAQLQDVREAIRWLRLNAASLNVDPHRIGGWGYSAGGHLVALAASESSDDGARLQAVVAGGTPADLPHYPQSPIITRFIGKTYAEDPKAWAVASPLTHVTPATAPMFLYHGTWDRLVAVEDTVHLHDALLAAGVKTELFLIPGAGHIATFLFGFGAEGAAVDFLDDVLERRNVEALEGEAL